MDGYIIGSAAALVSLVTLVASALPVWRATSVNPVEALRYE
jgi:ABC-type antimicrobial peptide transport system permease subunit